MNRSAIPFRNLLMIAALGMIVLGSGIYFGVNLAVDRAVAVDAEQKARGWAHFFIDTMPGMDRLLETGVLDQEQHAVVTAAESLGDVFRFKLFDSKGDMVLVSDEAKFNAEPPVREHNVKAAHVLASGLSNISLNDGRGQQNRPPLFVEAYVPMFGSDGVMTGIVEVYIDQTHTAGLFRTTFAFLAIGLAVIAALAFGLPTLAFLLRSKQAREAKQRVEFLAHHDPMTGLLNRSSFTEQLDTILKTSKDPLAVVFFDVDDFKAINDTHGHEAGDEFLKHVGQCIAGAANEGDLAGRPGGDEFILCIANRKPEDVIAAIEATMQAVREPILIRGRSIMGRVSAGLYLVEPGSTMADAMHKADVALYQAKIDGGNTYRTFSEDMEARMRARRALEQKLRDAMPGKNFLLHFQPLLHADTKKCAGFEALIRLPDGDGPPISPSVFIPVAEAMGLISEIGKWVIDEATRIAAAWPPSLFVSVNLSAKQFEDGQLVGHVRAALAASGLRPAQLELEVTESMLMQNTESVGSQLEALRELGISIAMDDFGTGYSSLGYLWQFGFDKLKIDRSFVAALDVHDQQARDILDIIIMLGHKLDMTVTAEGIETEHQASILNALACDHFQGYLYGRPAPAEDIASYLINNLAPDPAPRLKRLGRKIPIPS